MNEPLKDTTIDETNYFNVKYRKQGVFMNMKRTIREHLITGGFHLLVVSDRFSQATVSFLQKHYTINSMDDIKRNVKMWPIDIVLADAHNLQSMYPEPCKLILHSNNVMTTEKIQQFFSQELKKWYGIENYKFIPVKEEDLDVDSPLVSTENSLFGSFDMSPPETNTSSKDTVVLRNLSELSLKEMNFFVPVLPVNAHYPSFYRGMKKWFSELSEINEASLKQVN